MARGVVMHDSFIIRTESREETSLEDIRSELLEILVEQRTQSSYTAMYTRPPKVTPCSRRNTRWPSASLNAAGDISHDHQCARVTKERERKHGAMPNHIRL